MPVYKNKSEQPRSKNIRITDKKDNELFFLLKTLDCISKKINAYTTLDKHSKDELSPILIKNGVLLIEMQLFSEKLYFISQILENNATEIFSNARFKVYTGHTIKLMIKDVHKGNIFVHQNAIPVLVKKLSEEYKPNIEKSTYTEQINNILKKYM